MMPTGWTARESEEGEITKGKEGRKESDKGLENSKHIAYLILPSIPNSIFFKIITSS